MFSMGTLLLRIRIMSDMSDFRRIFRIMSNSDNIENRIRYIHLTSILKTNTNTDIHINIWTRLFYSRL
jgi:hypothetical protein